jgi:hypothetical protein
MDIGGMANEKPMLMGLPALFRLSEKPLRAGALPLLDEADEEDEDACVPRLRDVRLLRLLHRLLASAYLAWRRFPEKSYC